MYHEKHFGTIDGLRKSIIARRAAVGNRDFAQAYI
jgi:hypothetical protein